MVTLPPIFRTLFKFEESGSAATGEARIKARTRKVKTFFNMKRIKRLILTASGGPFKSLAKEKFEKLTAKDALKHPTWHMGPKITIDSATLMNKGLEVIEAHYLFDVDYCKIEVLIHPQSIIHSMVEFIDGSIKAQLGAPDMRIPIQYALFGMNRQANLWKKLDFLKVKNLTFEKPDKEKFPCLDYAYSAGRLNGTMPAVLNAANEAAVNLFLRGKISFPSIATKIRLAMTQHSFNERPSFEDIIRADQWARDLVKSADMSQSGYTPPRQVQPVQA